MLTGIGETGTVHNDAISFAAELKLGTNSPVIELPNDAVPGEIVTYALRPSNHPVEPPQGYIGCFAILYLTRHS